MMFNTCVLKFQYAFFPEKKGRIGPIELPGLMGRGPCGKGSRFLAKALAVQLSLVAIAG
jgi:hypothetical protein